MSLDIAAELPRAQRALYTALSLGRDVSIAMLFAIVATEARAGVINCGQQQYLGPYITKLNRRLAKHRLAVKPGVARASYRLVNL